MNQTVNICYFKWAFLILSYLTYDDVFIIYVVYSSTSTGNSLS